MDAFLPRRGGRRLDRGQFPRRSAAGRGAGPLRYACPPSAMRRSARGSRRRHRPSGCRALPAAQDAAGGVEDGAGLSARSCRPSGLAQYGMGQSLLHPLRRDLAQAGMRFLHPAADGAHGVAQRRRIGPREECGRPARAEASSRLRQGRAGGGRPIRSSSPQAGHVRRWTAPALRPSCCPGRPAPCRGGPGSAPGWSGWSPACPRRPASSFLSNWAPPGSIWPPNLFLPLNFCVIALRSPPHAAPGLSGPSGARSRRRSDCRRRS